jgi:hypothetical protein
MRARGAAGIAGEARRPDRGAALIGAVLLAAALAVLAAAVGWFALIGSQTSAAAAGHAEVVAAVQAGLEIAAGALATEPDLVAVRLGATSAATRGVDRLVTADGLVDVEALSRRLDQRRRRLPSPAGDASWRPYAWGRLGELAPAMPGSGARDPLVVVWVRSDDGGGQGPEVIELAIEAIAPSGARAAAIAILHIRPAGATVLSVWPEDGIAGPG